jgi:YD repeat-containing protein
LSGSLDGNGQSTAYTYSANGNVTQILVKANDGTVTSKLDYSYDGNGRPIAELSLDGRWSYAYDAAGQLIHAIVVSTNASIANQDLTYVYDAAGNRTQTIFNGVTHNYTTNGLNQYTAVDGTTYDYDADGNLISETQNGVATEYTYNSLVDKIARKSPRRL